MPPENDFCSPPKTLLPPKIFQKTKERTIETTAYCLKIMVYCLMPPPLNIFLTESQDLGTHIICLNLDNSDHSKEPVKLIERMKIVLIFTSYDKTVSVYDFKLVWVALHPSVKEFFGTIY